MNDLVCLKIKDERLYFDIYNKTDGKTYEHNTFLQVKKIFALQNILMDVDNYIYFSKCISRFSDLYLFEEKDNTSLKKNIKIKSVKIHSLYLKGDSEKNTKINDIKNVYKEIYCENNYINECNSNNNTKINLKSYFPDYFKFTKKKIYVNKNYNNNDDCNISLKSYKYLEYSKYSYIICKLKKIYFLNSENLYQTINSVEIEDEKEKSIRGNFDILYFYVQNENYNYSLSKINLSNYENSMQIFNNNYEDNIDYMESQLNNRQIDHYIEDKYNILQNEEIYNSVVDPKNRINHSMDHTNILYDNNNNEIENYSYDINAVKDNYENINVHKLKNIENGVNSLNSVLPKYIQLINMYPIYCDIRKLFLISRFKWDYYEDTKKY
ncbi:homeobox-containing protein [Plasmodium yoelii yoelii]|uniref:Homeobox-containing protein n=1 Tax=Plasmodium yoelii yoelii TaxID=73239 RepID=Q7RP13_PLAYO|nr:homeobox-containing protein [Plasmodium yoelii yoelii]